MSEAPTPVEGIPRRVPIEDTEITPSTGVRWPLIGILAGAVGLVTVAIVAGERYSAHQRATTAVEAAMEDGGIVSTRRLRRILRKMEIACAPVEGGGMACKVTLPEEAE